MVVNMQNINVSITWKFLESCSPLVTWNPHLAPWTSMLSSDHIQMIYWNVQYGTLILFDYFCALVRVYMPFHVLVVMGWDYWGLWHIFLSIWKYSFIGSHTQWDPLDSVLFCHFVSEHSKLKLWSVFTFNTCCSKILLCNCSTLEVSCLFYKNLVIFSISQMSMREFIFSTKTILLRN